MSKIFLPDFMGPFPGRFKKSKRGIHVLFSGGPSILGFSGERPFNTGVPCRQRTCACTSWGPKTGHRSLLSGEYIFVQILAPVLLPAQASAQRTAIPQKRKYRYIYRSRSISFPCTRSWSGQWSCLGPRPCISPNSPALASARTPVRKQGRVQELVDSLFFAGFIHHWATFF